MVRANPEQVPSLPMTMIAMPLAVSAGHSGNEVSHSLPYRPPLNWPLLAGFLASRGAAGVEVFEDQRYSRTLEINKHRGWLAIQPATGQTPNESTLEVQISPSLAMVHEDVLARIRNTFDLNANPRDIDAHLAADDVLRPRVSRNPGLRVPGAFDGFELALRAVLGQQVSVKAATTLYGRFASTFGEPIETPSSRLSRLGPQAGRVAKASLEQLIRLGLTGARAATVQHLARAVAKDGLRLDPDAGFDETRARLIALPGIGDWTAQYIAMRALRDPDAFPASDLGVMKALSVKSPREAARRAEGWRPWRAYAVMHLWQSRAGG